MKALRQSNSIYLRTEEHVSLRNGHDDNLLKKADRKTAIGRSEENS